MNNLVSKVKETVDKLKNSVKKAGTNMKNILIKKPAFYIASSVAVPFVFFSGCPPPSGWTGPPLPIVSVRGGRLPSFFGGHNAFPDWAISKAKEDGWPDYGPNKIIAAGKGCMGKVL